jgi:NADPH:quinone reductase-like Zn-dependent oxidoreductase
LPEDWPSQLSKILGEALLDCVIDSAGGEILQQTTKILKGGGKPFVIISSGCLIYLSGKVVCYGMYAVSNNS